jgi:16S rRNA (uracil1498-N3)-methyltransferase
MHRFLVPDWTGQQHDTIYLPEEERHHARVVRLRDGEEIEIFDGSGASCRAVFETPNEGEARARMIERLPDRHRESARSVTLAIAPLKKDRLEWIVEKATELGVARIVTFDCERGVAKPSDGRRQRWQPIAVAAAKQCGRTVVPMIDEVAELGDVLAEPADLCILCDTSGSPAPLADVLAGAADDAAILLLIGPEGGFGNRELQLARAAGARFAGLGARTLRAETAALAALAVVGNREPGTGNE